jgi:uncharacterized protein YkwD
MRKYLKKHFLPHESNRYHPHFFRGASVLLMLLVLTGSFFTLSHTLRTLPKNSSFAAIFVGALISYTNEARADLIHTPPGIDRTLKTSELLTQAAQLKANDMAARSYFAHNSPDGKTPWYWLEQVGYQYVYAGENLAIDFVDSKDVTEAWLASPGHRANMLNANLKEIGIATAVGMYQGRETTFVVQMFATPLPLPTPEVAPVPARQLKNPSAFHVPAAVELAIASPKASAVSLYYLFVAIVALLVLIGAIYEFRKHHKGMWLSGGVLIATSLILIVMLTFQTGGMV